MEVAMKGLTTVAGAALLAATASSAHAKLNVFACFPEWASLAEAIGGDRVEVFLASSPLENPDYVAPTPGLIAELGNADLIVCTGAHFEDEWLPTMLDRAGNPKVAVGTPGHFLASDFVTLLKVEEGPEAADGDHHLHEEGNPHVQGDPRNVLKIGAQLTKRLIELDPEGEAAYAERFKGFAADLKALTAELEKQAASLRGERIAVQHEHSVYVLDWLGIVAAATVEPEPGVPPGPEHLSKVIAAVPANQIRFVISAGYEDASPSKYVAEKAGILVVKVPFTVGGTEGATDLLTFYRDTVERLLDGLNGRERS
jgi:zinc/manganese transport system substrate-binding protein